MSGKGLRVVEMLRVEMLRVEGVLRVRKVHTFAQQKTDSVFYFSSITDGHDKRRFSVPPGSRPRREHDRKRYPEIRR
jgi:hypothetical protein